MRIDIESVGPGAQAGFGEIWLPWLRNSMGLEPEPEDLAAMADPAAYYGRNGGAAWLARLEGQIVGAVAVKSLGASGHEFCKLVVAEAARGHGVGRALVETCLEYGASQKGPALYLQSFNKLAVALAMYRRMGFQDAGPPPEMTVLARTEVIMAKSLA